MPESQNSIIGLGGKMSLSTAEKKIIIDKYKRSTLDCGSPEVQIAVLSYKIQKCSEHLQKNKQDHSGRLGLYKMVSQRRRLLKYIKSKDELAYNTITADLGIRK